MNQDRHPNNYGHLRDEATGALVAPAPLFDHNLSLFAWDMETDVPSWADAGRLRMPCNSRMAYDAQVALVMRPRQLLEIAPVDDARYADVMEKARARLVALPAVAAGAVG